MRNLIRAVTGLAACCLVGLTPAALFAQSQDPSSRADAPATEADTPQDAAIADRVSAALKAEPHDFYRHVTVTVKNGVVRLGGMAYSNDAIARAKKIASQTAGVSKVENQIQLERQGPNTPGN